MSDTCFIIGGGEHARVVAEALALVGKSTQFIVLEKTNPNQILEVDFFKLDATPKVICGVGSVGPQGLRRRILTDWQKRNVTFANAIHPSAILSSGAALGQGIFIAAGANIGVAARIEDHVIVNTGAIVDHDCVLGRGTHVAPGAVLSGKVHCGEFVHIGTGAIIIQGIHLANGVTIGAGTVVLNSIEEENSAWVGNPARRLPNREVHQ